MSGMTSLMKSVTGVAGDLVHSTLDRVLPKELQFLSGILAGGIDLASPTPNKLGALKHFIDSALDLKDLASGVGKAFSDATHNPQRTWQYEPPPPPWFSVQISINGVPVRGGAQLPPPAPGWQPVPSPTTWRGAPQASPPTTYAPSNATSLTNPGFMADKTDQQFMDAISNGNIPPSVSNDPKAMLALQQRMNRIAEMNQLMTNMIKAMHDMRMAVIQNIRV